MKTISIRAIHYTGHERGVLKIASTKRLPELQLGLLCTRSSLNGYEDT
jgi:hypothetical protein